MSRPTRSAVIVEIPDAEPLVAASRAALDASAALGVPAHVTVLYPFRPPEQLTDPTLERLALAVAGVATFEATFAATGWFDERVVFVVPEPDSAFRALTDAVSTAFPDQLPYDGAHDDVVPHLTLGHDQPLPSLRDAEAVVLRGLPLVQRVAEVALWTGSDATASWTRRAAFPLG